MWAYLSRCQDVVHVLKECLVFDLIVCEDECDTVTVQSCGTVEEFQVLHKVAHTVRPAGEENWALEGAAADTDHFCGRTL